jgi:hypothetical protein
VSTFSRIARRLIFVAVNVSLVGIYCFAMYGRLEPLKHHPTKFVTLPLMAITAVIAFFLYPLLVHLRLRLPRALMLYCGFVLICAIYGIYLWILFPDGSVFTPLVTMIGGQLYGWPVFLAVLVAQLVGARLFFPVVRRDTQKRGS